MIAAVMKGLTCDGADGIGIAGIGSPQRETRRPQGRLVKTIQSHSKRQIDPLKPQAWQVTLPKRVACRNCGGAQRHIIPMQQGKKKLAKIASLGFCDPILSDPVLGNRKAEKFGVPRNDCSTTERIIPSAELFELQRISASILW